MYTQPLSKTDCRPGPNFQIIAMCNHSHVLGQIHHNNLYAKDIQVTALNIPTPGYIAYASSGFGQGTFY